MIYFVLGSLSPGTDFEQLWHVAGAVEHYKMHMEEAKERGEKFTFSKFIYEHYVDPDSHTHSDDTAHDDLPIQHFHAPINFAIQGKPFLESNALILTMEQPIEFVPTYYSFLFGEGLYRPPSRS